MRRLTEYLIQTADGPAYRSGNLEGMRHPAVDGKMIRAAGGLRALIEEADELEKDGIIWAERKNLGADIVRIHYPVSAIPQLCRRVGIEDSRIRQIRWIKTAEKWARGAEGTFLSPYYEILTGRLQSGQEVKKPDMEDEDFFRCLNQIVLLETPVWRRQFSAEVLHDSKLFEKKYQSRIVTVLEEYSPLSEEGMSADDILRVHGIRIFLYNRRKLFPELKPYRMDPAAYETAIAEGAGIPLKKEKKEKLQKLEAGELDGLKKCILEKGMEIEQESLLFVEK